MDSLKNLGDQFSTNALKEKLEGMQFPASKDQVSSYLEQNGVPTQAVDRVRDADTSQFDSPDDVMSKVKSFM